jgi:predicted NBD/HSP70 family sugar kinase
VGCLMTFISEEALARQSNTLAFGRELPIVFDQPRTVVVPSPIEIGLAAEGGVPAAERVVGDSGRRLGRAIACLVSVFNPGCVVIGGDLTCLGYTLLPEVRSTVYHRSPASTTRDLSIVFSE